MLCVLQPMWAALFYTFINKLFLPMMIVSCMEIDLFLLLWCGSRQSRGDVRCALVFSEQDLGTLTSCILITTKHESSTIHCVLPYVHKTTHTHSGIHYWEMENPDLSISFSLFLSPLIHNVQKYTRRYLHILILLFQCKIQTLTDWLNCVCVFFFKNTIWF